MEVHGRRAMRQWHLSGKML